jgi:hypothetical protein
MGMAPAKPTCLSKASFKATMQAFASHGSADRMQLFQMQQWRLRFAVGYPAQVITLSLPKIRSFKLIRNSKNIADNSLCGGECGRIIA